MEQYIRILGIAPYESMKNQMLQLAKEYPYIQLTVLVGDMEDSLLLLEGDLQEAYDIVISRGATAKIVQQNRNIPVVEIEISIYDILCTLKLSGGLQKKTALVFMADIEEKVLRLCDLLECNADIYPICSMQELEITLNEVIEKNYSSILCDMIANTKAQQMNINSYLITSGTESIRNAFEQAVVIYQSQKSLRDENAFFQELLQGQTGKTVVFDQNQSLILSNLENPDEDFLEVLQKECEKTSGEILPHFSRSLKGVLYSIDQKRIIHSDSVYIAFFIDIRKTPALSNQAGIQYYTHHEIEKFYYNTIFSFAENVDKSKPEMDRVIQSRLPLIISGEEGTGKMSAVYRIYLQGSEKNHFFILINCSLLTQRSWTFLMENANSPLGNEKNLICFSNIDELSIEKQNQLTSMLMELETTTRNRVIFSSVCNKNERISKTGAFIQNKIRAQFLYLFPLREQIESISVLINVSLSHMNAHMTNQILGANVEAVALLKTYRWPYNYTQFWRVIEEVASYTKGQYITEETVLSVLEKERHMGILSFKEEAESLPIDLNRTLEEINLEIALRVLSETNGNQTATAKRLGISRTTLWRLLQK